MIYPNDINNWWRLRLNIYSLIFCLLFYISNIKTSNKLEKYFNFFVYLGFGLTTSDAIDRWFLNINYITWTDLIMVILVLIIGYRKHLCQSKKYKS